MSDQIETIARAFARTIRDAAAEIDSETDGDSNTMALINARNATPEYACCCASHDFFDSNMGMACAFEKVTGRESDAASEADAALWNAAWNLAVANNFWA